MAEIMNKNDFSAELARRCQNSEGFKGDMNVAQAQHVMKHVREMIFEIDDQHTATYWLRELFDIKLITVSERR